MHMEILLSELTVKLTVGMARSIQRCTEHRRQMTRNDWLA